MMPPGSAPRDRRAPRPHASRGVSLVELLVGIAIGMLTVLAITQMFLVADGQRRVPASLAATQVNGILALDAIQRDVQQAGYGLGGGPWLGCKAAAVRVGDRGLSALRLAPVVITPRTGADPSDRVTVLYSGKMGPAVPMRLAEAHAATAEHLVVTSHLGVRHKDWLVLATEDGAACAAILVEPGDAGRTAIACVDAGGDPCPAGRWSVAYAPPGPGDFPAGSVLVNLGEYPVYREWHVAGEGGHWRLRVTDLATPDPAAGAERHADDAFADVVLLRALYAKDTDGDGLVDTYDAVTPTDGSGWAQVRAVRLALVVRSGERVKGEAPVTPVPLAWNLGHVAVPGAQACADDASGHCLTLTLDHTTPGGGDEWQFYRYRLFDTLVPVRNLIWNVGATP
jgi:type IV pilus assembly protein PilW